MLFIKIGIFFINWKHIHTFLEGTFVHLLFVCRFSIGKLSIFVLLQHFFHIFNKRLLFQTTIILFILNFLFVVSNSLSLSQYRYFNGQWYIIFTLQHHFSILNPVIILINNHIGTKIPISTFLILRHFNQIPYCNFFPINNLICSYFVYLSKFLWIVLTLLL